VEQQEVERRLDKSFCR